MNDKTFYIIDWHLHVFLNKALAEAQRDLIEKEIRKEVEDYKEGRIFTCHWASHELMEDGKTTIAVDKSRLPRVHEYPVGTIDEESCLNFIGREKIGWN